MQSDDLGLVAMLRQSAELFEAVRAMHAGAEGADAEPHWSLQAEAETAHDLASEAAAAIERLVAERDEARAEVARYWTSADMTPWVNLAEEKGLGHFGKKLKGMFNRAMTAEAASRSYAEALRQIADLDEVESALDPEWTINRARQALKDAP